MLALIQEQINVAKKLQPYAVISGGLAWHLMSREHKEGYYYDHKDIDVLTKTGYTVQTLKNIGFVRQRTVHDSERFMRFVKYREGKKITVDLFFEDTEYITVEGIRVVRPDVLAGYYRSDRWTRNLEILKEEYLSYLI